MIFGTLKNLFEKKMGHLGARLTISRHFFARILTVPTVGKK